MFTFILFFGLLIKIVLNGIFKDLRMLLILLEAFGMDKIVSMVRIYKEGKCYSIYLYIYIYILIIIRSIIFIILDKYSSIF